MRCHVCNKLGVGYIIDILNADPKPSPTWICSPSCLVEWAWEQKSAQPKLSKSKAE